MAPPFGKVRKDVDALWPRRSDKYELGIMRLPRSQNRKPSATSQAKVGGSWMLRQRTGSLGETVPMIVSLSLKTRRARLGASSKE